MGNMGRGEKGGYFFLYVYMLFGKNVAIYAFFWVIRPAQVVPAYQSGCKKMEREWENEEEMEREREWGNGEDESRTVKKLQKEKSRLSFVDA